MTEGVSQSEQDPTSKSFNWPVAAVLTLTGLLFGGAGVYLAENKREAWTAVLINVAVAVGLAAFLTVVEARLIRVVTKATIETVRRETDSLNERVLRLEDLDDAQREERARRDRERRERLAEIENSAVTIDTVGELVRAAAAESLIALDGPMRVRSSDNPLGHTLWVMGYGHGVAVEGIVFDFAPFKFEGDTARLGGDRVPLPLRRKTTVMWTSEAAAEIAVALEDGLMAENEPLFGFSLSYALNQLKQTVAIARGARQADATDPRRLQGRIVMLLNDAWVWTDYGLESVETPEAYEMVEAYDTVIGGGAGRKHSELDLPESKRELTDPQWLDALDCLQRQTRVTIEYGAAERRRREADERARSHRARADDIAGLL